MHTLSKSPVRAAVLALAIVPLLFGCGGGGGGSASSPPTLPPTVPPGATLPPATPTPMPSSTATAAPTAPPAFATLFSGVSAQINSFTNSVNAQCAGASFPTKIYTDLLPANGSFVVNTLPGASAATVQMMANNAVAQAMTFQRTFGITGVTLSVSYPLLVANPANFPNSSWSTANYATFLSYYQQVVQGLRAAGLGVNVEANLVFPTYVTSSSFNYSGITVPILESGLAEQVQHIIDYLRPDNVTLANEPSTLQYNTGLSAINDPAGYASYVSAIRSQVSTANSPTTKLGAGSDDWQSTAFTTDLLSVPLDFYDYHIYPPDDLQAGISGLQQLRASRKPIIITETWDDKEDASVDGTTGPIDSQTVYVRGSYSFWGNVDAQYITSIVKLARCDNVQSINVWDADHFFAYVDYNATSSGYSYSQMQTAVNTTLLQNEANGTITPAGYAIKQATGLAPSSLMRR